jgi:hypothetical protein
MPPKFKSLGKRQDREGVRRLYLHREEGSNSELIAVREIALNRVNVTHQRKTLEFKEGKGTVLALKESKTYRNLTKPQYNQLLRDLSAKPIKKYRMATRSRR